MTRFGLPLLLALALYGCDGSKTDSVEDTAGDTSGDGVVVQEDADGDTILDIHEGTDDEDGDEKPNFEDQDADGDSIRDVIEAGDSKPATLPVDSDGDGVYDYLDQDSDGNCVADSIEAGRSDGGAVDSDGDDIRDFQDTDNDNDGILDSDEVGVSDCESPTNTDGDELADYLDPDSDGDGIGDIFESGTTDFSSDPVDSNNDGTPDFQDTDSDGDSISDRDESGLVEGDGLIAPRDSDGDGRYDYADEDADGDSLADLRELDLGTNPFDPDTDGDGFSDGAEDTAGTDPLDSESRIEGIYVIVPERTTVEENFEFELNIEMGDIAFIIDTTCSMGGTITAVATEFSQIVNELEELLPDAAYGVGGHDDYPYGGMGSPGSDKPFYLRQAITTDESAVQSAFSSLGTHSGADGPESGTEALYQAASGAGYDQDCDGTYDTQLDVYPFMASAGDPFGGVGGQEYEEDTVDGGTIGGFGFREYSLPIIVIASDNYFRDADSTAYYGATPGGCPIDAGMSDAVAAFADIGAYFVGVSVNGTTGYPQMITFANATGSLADLDGDGVAAEEVVQTWSGSNAAFRETIVEAITQLVASIKFERVDLSVENDPNGFVTSIDPPYYAKLGADDSGTILTFTLTFRGTVAATTEDQLYLLTLNVLGDSSILLDSLDIIVLVPGTAF